MVAFTRNCCDSPTVMSENLMEPRPSLPGERPELDALYDDELAPLEQREADAIEYGRLDLLPGIRAAMLPIKAKINELEGIEIYPL